MGLSIEERGLSMRITISIKPNTSLIIDGDGWD